MRRRDIFSDLVFIAAGLLALVLFAQSPRAQFNSFPPGAFTGRAAIDAGGAVYTGPGDVKPYVAWWGMSAYSSATRGNKAVNVCDQATGLTCVDWSTDATTGALVSTNIGGSACNVIACEAATIYDQVAGNGCSAASCDLITAHADGRIPIVASGPNSSYCFSSVNAVNGGNFSANNLSQSAPWSAAVLANRTGHTTGIDGALVQISDIRVGYANAANTTMLYSGGSITNGPTASDNALHAIGYVSNNASSLIGVDAISASTVNIGSTTGWTGKPGVGKNAILNAVNFTGIICEGGIANATWSAADIQAVNANAHARYGVW